MLRTPTVIAVFIFTALLTSCNTVSVDTLNATYPKGEGSTVYIDEAHNNFHTVNGGYSPFANVLRRDGYVVKGFKSEFSKDSLADVDILVICNALNQRNVRNWTVPCPSAFTESEIKSLVDWVEQGGSLFLIADHMPFGGAAADLARAFGFKFSNAFAMKKIRGGPSTFSVRHNTLVESIVTRGRSEQERVTKVDTYTGQAFLVPKGAREFTSSTPSREIKGWSQGAYVEFGQGRLVMFGEAAVFRMQGTDGSNFILLLNLIHWLDGLLNEEESVE